MAKEPFVQVAVRFDAKEVTGPGLRNESYTFPKKGNEGFPLVAQALLFLTKLFTFAERAMPDEQVTYGQFIDDIQKIRSWCDSTEKALLEAAGGVAPPELGPLQDAEANPRI